MKKLDVGSKMFELLPLKQKEQRLRYNQTYKELDKTLLPMKIMQIALLYPEREAFVSSIKRLTYKQLHNAAADLAGQFSSYGLSKNSHVAIHYEKGWQQVVSALACGYAGFSFLPISSDTPIERVNNILKQADVQLILTDVTTQLGAEEVHSINITEIVDFEKEAGTVEIEVASNDIAYTIFTSGSTGNPKGVVITHESVANTIYDINERFSVNKDDVFFNISAFNFDLSIYDIFGSLSVGAKLVMPDEDDKLEPAKWHKMMIDEGVTIWNSVPAVINLLLDYKLEESVLRLILLSGDVIKPSLVGDLQKRLPKVDMIALGGATEASIWSIYYKLNDFDGDKVPYGYPLANQTIHILNDALQELPDGEQGEIYIGGKGVAESYLNDKKRTDEQFLYVPEKLYKTGDIGFFDSKGYVEIIGRKDNQVKVQGYRIELEEVEHHISLCPNVYECSVNTVKDKIGNNVLIAFVAFKTNSCNVSDFLQDKIPNYMIPTHIKVLEKLPRTANNKVDKKLLLENYYKKQKLAENYVAPRNHTEEHYCDMFAEVLGVEKVGIKDNFFDLGGHSLLAIKLVAKLNEITQDNIPLMVFFEASTVEELVEKLHAKQIHYNLITPLQKKGNKTPIFAVPGIGGIGLSYQYLVKAMGDEHPFYTFQANGFDEDVVLHKSIEEIAKLYIEHMKKVHEGPYVILGFSFGSLLAYEIARQLGSEVKLLIIMDLPSPTVRRSPIYKFLVKARYVYGTLKGSILKKEEDESVLLDKTLPKFILNNYSLMHKYHPLVMNQATKCIVFIASQHKNPQRHKQELYCWQNLFPHNQLKFVEVDTNHNTFLKEKNSVVVANILKRYL